LRENILIEGVRLNLSFTIEITAKYLGDQQEKGGIINPNQVPNLQIYLWWVD
jgi:hypothetical protein